MPDVGADPVRLWDRPVRIVHWSLVALVPALWWTGEEGELATHMTLGSIMVGLVLFRLLWGLFGSSTARFARFVRGPATILAYLRGRAEPVVGHNPLGGLSVIALLLVLTGQVTAGLFATDVDGLESGPLSYLVSYETADLAREAHHLLFNILLGLIALHVAAILFYTVVRRQNLVTAMLTGRRRFATIVPPPTMASELRAFAIAALAAGLALWLAYGAPLGR
jgi:cytochrome b